MSIKKRRRMLKNYTIYDKIHIVFCRRMIMAKGTNYQFRVRENEGKMWMNRPAFREEVRYDRFSKPNVDRVDLESHETIIRAPFKDKNDKLEKYL